MRVVVEPGSDASSSSVAAEAPVDVKPVSPSAVRANPISSSNSDTKGMRLRDLIFQAAAAEPVLTSSKNSLFKKPAQSTGPKVRDVEEETRPVHPLAQPPSDNNHIVLQTEQEMMIAKAIASMDPNASSSTSSSSAAMFASRNELASPSSDNGDNNDTGADKGTAPWSSQIVRKRGRPRKTKSEDGTASSSAETPTPKRPPGRPRKTVVVTAAASGNARETPSDIPKSQYRGVSWDRRMGMWRVKANAVHIGFFADEKEAAMAYDKAKLSLHGTSPSNRGIGLNFPENHPGARQITKGEPKSDNEDVDENENEDEEEEEDGEEAEEDKEEDESASGDAAESSAAFKPLSSSSRSSAPLGDGDVYNQKQLTAGSYTVQATQQVIHLNNPAEPEDGPPTVTAAVRLNKKTADRPSRYRGVMWDYGTRSWRSKIKVKGKTWYLGVFADEEQAARAYDSAACFVARDRSTLNFPQTDYSSIPLPRPPPSWVITHVNELREQTANKKGAIAAAVGDHVAEQILTGVTQRYSAKRKYFQHPEDEEEAGAGDGPEQEDQDDEDDDDGDEEAAASADAGNGDVRAFLGKANRVSRDELEPARLALLQQQYLELSSPLKMLGVTRIVDDGNKERFEARVDFQGHSLCVGSDFTTAAEACRSYDITLLKLKGTESKSDLNCPPTMIPILLREPLPQKLEMLVKGLYPLTSLYHGRSKKEKTRAKVSEARQALTTVRDQYRRRKAATGTSNSPVGADAASEDVEDGSATTTAGATSTAGATLAQLSAHVRRISDSLREDADEDHGDREGGSAKRSSKRVKSSSSSATVQSTTVAELAEAARRALEQAAKANASSK